MSCFSLKTLEAEQNILSKYISAVEQEKRKLQTVHLTMWRCLFIPQRIFFYYSFCSLSLTYLLCLLPSHTLYVWLKQPLIYSIKTMFHLKSVFVTKHLFFLVHCCVTNSVAELTPIISLICSKEKGRFLKTWLLRTPSWILRLKYESKYCLIIYMWFISIDIGHDISISLVEKHVVLGTNNWTSSCLVKLPWPQKPR